MQSRSNADAHQRTEEAYGECPKWKLITMTCKISCQLSSLRSRICVYLKLFIVCSLVYVVVAYILFENVRAI